MGLSEVAGAGAVEAGARRVTGKDVPGILHAQHELLTRILEKLNSLPEGLRQSLADHLWAEIPSTFEEYGYSPAATQVNTTVTNQGVLRRVETIYTFCGGNQTGWLQLGSTLTIPVPAGAFVIPSGAAILLRDSDVHSLSLGTPGAQSSTPALVFVALWGHVLPRFGEFS